MAESNLDKGAETTSSASSADELIKDLDVKLSSDAQDSVVGGGVNSVVVNPAKMQHEYLVIKMNDVFITSVTHG